MQHTKTITGIKCRDCGFQGPYKSNNASLFMVFMAMVILSAFFLPLIIVALAYLVWILSKPSTKICSECQSTNLDDILIEVRPNITKPEQSEN